MCNAHTNGFSTVQRYMYMHVRIFVALPWYSFEVYPAEQYGEHHPVIMEHTSSNTVVHKLQNKIHDIIIQITT